jgi:signal transduction histidine kinase/ActR/RegA family two-component response regulator
MRMGGAIHRTAFFPVAGLSLATLATVTALFLIRAETRSNHWVQHSLNVQVTVGQLIEHVRAIESDNRGYLLTGNPRMKTELAGLVAGLEPAVDTLAAEVSDNPRQRANILQLREALTAKARFALATTSPVDLAAKRDAIAQIEAGTGARLMNNALAIMHRMKLEEDRLLVIRRKATDRIVLGTGVALLLTVVAALLVAALVLRDARRRERELTLARDEALAAGAAMRDQINRRERVEAQVRQMQKMESIGQLTGGIAHDFNNMLAIVIGSLDLAKRRLRGDPEKLERCIANAYEGAERAASLTARLLAFSRQQPLAPLTLDVNKLVSGMSELLRRTMGEQFLVETVLAGGLWRTMADPGQLENTLVNLAINARDAMDGGGRMTIETANAYLDDEYCRDRADVSPGQYVMISVSDTGTGMTPEVIAKAFEPFFTTKPVGRGTGLGLSQIFGFMKQTGGHVAIYSEVGQGTTVKLYLPRGTGEAVEPQIAALNDRIAPEARPGEVILVVEDESRVRHFSVDALRELGYVVLSAPNGAAALRLLADQPQISMLFTDIMMPEMNGRQLADSARALVPELKVLFTTGYTRNAVVHNGMLDAGVAFLPKPFSVQQLAMKVRDVLDGGGVNRPLPVGPATGVRS